MAIFLLSTLIALGVSFVCSLTEAVLLSLNHVKIETDKGKGLHYAKVLHHLKGNISRPISAILILNTVAHTGGATIAGSAFDEIYGDQHIWLFSTVFTLAILFGTEILPKVVGVANSDMLAKYIAVPLNLTIKLLYPFILITELFNRLVVKKKNKPAKFSVEDIQTIARVAQVENVINKDQENIIVRTSSLKDRAIAEIMMPLAQVVFLRQDIGVEEYFDLAEQHLHTRYPVSASNSPQHISGYLNFKEIALYRDDIKSDEGLKKFIRPILFVNSHSSIIHVLKLMSDRKYHLAIVQDDAKNNLGMVTLEDIVEEIVGDIVDEFDTE